MFNYSDKEKSKDFDFFKSQNISFFNEHGYQFLAIKNQKIIDFKESVTDLISSMAEKGFDMGSYLIQECKGLDTDTTNVIMRLRITA